MSTTITNVQSLQLAQQLKENSSKKNNALQYGLSAAIPAVAGLTHGIYKKMTEVELDKVKLNQPSKGAPQVLVLARLIRSNDAISFATPVGTTDKMLEKTLIDDSVNIMKQLHRNHMCHSNLNFNILVECLMELGFDPKNLSIVSFVKKYGVEELNKDLKEKFNIDFHIEIEKGMGRKGPIYEKVLDINLGRGSLSPLEIEVKKETSYFKKILNPYDEKLFAKIEKLPFGKKFTDFMRKTKAPIRQFSFKPLKKLYYDTTSMFKGAGICALSGVALCAGVKAISKCFDKKGE